MKNRLDEMNIDSLENERTVLYVLLNESPYANRVTKGLKLHLKFSYFQSQQLRDFDKLERILNKLVGVGVLVSFERDKPTWDPIALIVFKQQKVKEYIKLLTNKIETLNDKYIACLEERGLLPYVDDNTEANNVNKRKEERPKNWELKDDEGQGLLIKDGKTIFTFRSVNTLRYLYFKCLWESYGKRVTYTELSNSKPPEQMQKDKDKKPYKVNDAIRKTFKKLKSDLAEAELNQISIKIEHGAILSITPEHS